MHIAFIAYGMRSKVELLLRDMEAQKHFYKMWKKGEKDKLLPASAQLRILPFGVFEYICPREDLDIVLNTLGNNPHGKYITNFKKEVLRKALKLQKIPAWKTEKIFLWMKEHVNIILLGIREDEDIIEAKGRPYEGWTHEAI